MRYRDRVITYSISDACHMTKLADVRKALGIIEEKTIISFEEVSGGGEIRYLCSNIAPKPEERDHFVAGEGGPSNIINASVYSVILDGKVSLYRPEKCPDPRIAIHETLHALGFDHNTNPESIMYPVSDCKQEIDNYIINEINSLYSVESRPDLLIESLEADKEGRYLSFEITVANFGVIDSKNSSLVIYSDETPARTLELEGIKTGVRKVLTVENLKLPRSSGRVSFAIETEEEEISKSNNAVELVSTVE